MNSLEDTPTYNLKAVVQETGLKPDTLRAWERRYGLPQPARTAGGHRIYSQRDIDILKWLIARQEEGLSISRAVDLWNQLLEEGKEPFLEMAAEEEPPTPTVLEVGDTLKELRDSWMDACLNFDERRAEYTLSQAFALYPPETVCMEVLQKGIAAIGWLWYEGQASVQQEHFASALAMRRLEALMAINPPPTRAGRILIGCAPDEEHSFNALLLTLILRRRGWDTLYLGASVPIERLAETIERTSPDLIVLTAQMLPTAAKLLGIAEMVREMEVPLAFGGRIFNVEPSVRDRIPGYFLGERLQQAPQIVEQILTAPVLLVDKPERAEEYDRILAAFIAGRPQIERHVWQEAPRLGLSGMQLARANQKLADVIVAALTLGDLSLLKSDLEWVQGLIHNDRPHITRETLLTYLDVYHEGARLHLEGESQRLADWLADFVDQADAANQEE
ncbi:MAG: MerR family transcriptional regulator [Candidatus Promineifilaceae bacterium]|nr:MerR family transcriptional regulator [Candidatus Promineifilaceae bacterium]